MMHLIGFSYSFYLNLKQNKKEPLRLFHVFQLPEKTSDVISPFPQVKSSQEILNKGKMK